MQTGDGMEFNKPTHVSTGAKSVNGTNGPKPATAWAGNPRPTEPVERRVAPAKEQPVVRRRKPRRVLKALLALLLVGALSVGAWFGFQKIAYAGIDKSRYQAVYLDNDNVYFGKVRVLLGGNILLENVFRVQAAPDSTATNNSSTTDSNSAATQPSSEIRLIKPGKELHAPDDTMLINKGKVRFIENIGKDSSVAKAINDYQEDGDE